MQRNKENIDFPQIPLSKAVLLHLLPGILITIFYIIMVPLVTLLDFPNRLALLLAVPFVLVPFELGFLIYQCKKINNIISFKEVIFFRESMALWKYFLFTLILLFYALSITTILAPPIDNFILDKIFFWLPEWYILTASFIGYTKNYLIIMAIMSIIFNGFVGPIVEELYFRGFLLPRMSRLGVKGLFLNIIFHSAYHLWMPWRIPTLILALFPAALVVWKMQNIKLAILIHVIGNTLGSVLTLVLVLKI